MVSPLCQGPVWEDNDLSHCLRRQILGQWVPLVAISTSAVILIIQKSSKSTRQRVSASRLARLDPSSSNIVQETRDSENRPSFTIRDFLGRIPFFGPHLARFLGYHGSFRHRHARVPSVELASPSVDGSSSLAVFHTENAVIFNEVHRVMRERMFGEQQQHQRISKEGVEFIKRAWEAVGTITLAGISASGVVLGYLSQTWSFAWIYMALLSSYTLASPSSLFKHKALLFGLAFVISIIDLRSSLIGAEVSRADLVLSTAIFVLTTITFIPSVLFPLDTRLPMRLREIQKTIRAQYLHEQARTAIPTPRARQSPHAESSVPSALENARKSELLPLLPFPENRASVFSRAIFGFVTPSMLKHYRTQFTLDAVPDLPPGSHAASVVAAFRAGDAVNVKQSHEQTPADDSSDDGEDEDTALFGQQANLTPSQRPLAFRLARHFASLLGLECFWAFIEAVARLTPPIALRLILTYISHRSTSVTPLHVALLFPLLLAGGQLVASIAASQALYTGRKICIQARAILIFEIINKALRRRDTGGAAQEEEGQSPNESQEFKKRTSDGEVTNLVAIDVFRVSEVGAYLHFLFPQAPVEILLCIYLLFQILGPAAFVGVGVIVLAMPLQAFGARLFTRLQKKMLEATDKRLNLANEVLNCIKTVKFFAWEKPFEKRMDDTRQYELKYMKYRWGAWLLNYFLFLTIPMLVVSKDIFVTMLYSYSLYYFRLFPLSLRTLSSCSDHCLPRRRSQPWPFSMHCVVLWKHFPTCL